jgi:hypothetical protein
MLVGLSVYMDLEVRFQQQLQSSHAEGRKFLKFLLFAATENIFSNSNVHVMCLKQTEITNLPSGQFAQPLLNQ